MNSCFFIGHRESPDSIRKALETAIEYHIINYGVAEFYVGHHGRFDLMAQRALIQAKKRHPDIIVRLLLPYHPSERTVELPIGFDGTYYPPNMETVPRRFAIYRANHHMAKICDHLIAYVWHSPSNAKDILDHAQKRGVHIENLAPKKP